MKSVILIIGMLLTCGTLLNAQLYSARTNIGEYDTEVAYDNVPGTTVGDKFGNNGDVDATSTPEDIWASGGLYTGFNATAGEVLEILSSDVDDAGTLVSSGTATGGSKTTLVDSGANFTGDGVVAGDVLVNDTQIEHGVITNVTATTLTVWNMTDTATNLNLDAYRVVSAASTGAALVRVGHLRDSNLDAVPDAYVILNGTTGVSGPSDIMRCTRASVILAGSSGGNEGILTFRQTTTTANVFATIEAGDNQTLVAAYTTPIDESKVAKRLRVSISRASGAGGSAKIQVLIKRIGEVFRVVRDLDLTTSSPLTISILGGVRLEPGSDVLLRVVDVSDNDTQVEAAFEFYTRQN